MMMHLLSFLLLPSLRIARSSCRCLWLERNLGGKIEPTLIIWKRFRFFKNGCEWNLSSCPGSQVWQFLQGLLSWAQHNSSPRHLPFHILPFSPSSTFLPFVAYLLLLLTGLPVLLCLCLCDFEKLENALRSGLEMFLVLLQSLTSAP